MRPGAVDLLATTYGSFVAEILRIRPATAVGEHRTMVLGELPSRAEREGLSTFGTAFTATWKARTACAPAYARHVDCGNWDRTTIEARRKGD